MLFFAEDEWKPTQFYCRTVSRWIADTKNHDDASEMDEIDDDNNDTTGSHPPSCGSMLFSWSLPFRQHKG
jgi:hypothetical protein